MKRKKRQKALRARRLPPLRTQSRRDNSDVQGSYTGTPKDGGQPVQDVDDL